MVARGDPNSRQACLKRIFTGKFMCECEVMVAFGLTQPTASHHLEILEKARLVKSRREGKWIFFKLANAKILNLIENLASEAST